MKKIEAVIFDMDGTLVDNMSAHVQAWQEVVAELGLGAVPRERLEKEFAGLKNAEIVPRLLGRPADSEEVERIGEAKEARYRALYRPKLRLLDGAEELIARLLSERTACAVATAAPEANRALVLDGLMIGGATLRARFHTVVGAEDAPRGKPAPDLFLLAASRLGVDPERTLVFEDAVNGVLAAKAAGMVPVGVLTTESAERMREAGAIYLLHDFAALPEGLERLLFGA